MKVLILNGPPHCGKDTIGALLKDQYPCTTTCFKHDLYAEVAAYYGLRLDRCKELCTNRATKESKRSEFDWLTPRQALIHVSENVLKPKHGKDYFGKQAVNRINKVANLLLPVIVFTDGGFEEEVNPLHKAYDVTIVRLLGRGTFEGDSRNYIMHPKFKYLSIMLQEGNPQEAVDKIKEYLETC